MVAVDESRLQQSISEISSRVDVLYNYTAQLRRQSEELSESDLIKSEPSPEIPAVPAKAAVRRQRRGPSAGAVPAHAAVASGMGPSKFFSIII